MHLPELTVAEPVVGQLIHAPVFYPDTKRLPDLLMEMNRRKLQVVFLSNEYGRVSGIITPDEIVAEIAGTRPGSRQSRQPDVLRSGDGVFIVAATTDVEDFTHETGIKVPKGAYDTIGGCVLAHMGRIPDIGERVEVGDGVFVISDRDELHIKLLTVTARTRRPEARASE